MKLLKAINDYDPTNDKDNSKSGLSFKRGDLILLKDTIGTSGAWGEGFNYTDIISNAISDAISDTTNREGYFFPLNYTSDTSPPIKSEMKKKKKRKSKRRKSKKRKSKKYTRRNKK